MSAVSVMKGIAYFHPKMFNLNRIHISQFIYFFCVINCLNMNRIPICRAKCFGIVTLKASLRSCSRYNSEDKSPKFPIPKMKLNRINVS